MKRVYFLLLVVLALGITTLISCQKNQEQAKESTAVNINADELSKDESFIKLNDAINRFDPKYLTLVFNEPKTTDALLARSKELMLQLNTYPENIAFQKDLADFYHFSSVDQLKQYSAAITESLKALDTKYNFKRTLFVNGGGQMFYDARKLYAKNKLAAYPTVAKMSTTNGTVVKNGIWLDFVETYMSSFDYYEYVSSDDESLQAQRDGGGGFNCNESCCWERETCKSNAKSKRISNLWSYILGGSGAAAGAVGGSFIPFFGNVGGGFAGALWGGALGVIAANQVYQQDLEACNTTYKACIQKKGGN
jgi:hypothetical protein